MTTPRHLVLKEFSALSFDVFMDSAPAPSAMHLQPQPRSAPVSARDLFPSRTNGPADPTAATDDRRERDKALISSPDRIGARILIADDSSGIRSSLAKVLNAEGYEVELAVSGTEALERFAKDRPDLVLLDLDMPGGDGWEAFDRILRLNPQQAVIIITGKYGPRDWACSGQPGALVEKPIDVPALLDRIPEVLAESPESRESRVASQRTMTRHTRPVPFLRWQCYERGGLNE